MIAFDTNLLVRAVVADNPAQVAIVQRLIMQDSVFISRTVLLETEWVLRAVYMKSRAEILGFFKALLEIDNTEIEDSTEVGYALDWYAQGSDFVECMHHGGATNSKMQGIGKIRTLSIPVKRIPDFS